MEWLLQFEEVPKYENARHVVIKESKSQAVDIIQSISNLIQGVSKKRVNKDFKMRYAISFILMSSQE